MTAEAPGIAEHPDLVALRARYEKAGTTTMAQLVDGLTCLAGLYMAISPWVVGFEHTTAMTANNLIIGAAFAMLAVGFASAYGRTHGIAWITPLIGVWMIIAPWVIAATAPTMAMLLNNIIIGAVGVVLGCATVGVGILGRR